MTTKLDNLKVRGKYVTVKWHHMGSG